MLTENKNNINLNCWLYHGTDEKGYEEILECGKINPIYADYYNTPLVTIYGITYLPDGTIDNPNENKKLNPFFLSPVICMALKYGDVILKIHSKQINKIYNSHVKAPVINIHEIQKLEYFTYDIIPLYKFEIIKTTFRHNLTSNKILNARNK